MSEMMETENPYFDETGREIKEFAVIRVFHFIGARRKKHYMYKWVRLKEWDGRLYWIAKYLSKDSESGYYHLRTSDNNNDRILKGVMIVQQY